MKIFTYSVILTGLAILLTLAGVTSDLTELFGALGLSFTLGVGFTSFSIAGSAIFDFLFNTATGILSSLVFVGAIAASLFSRGRYENIILLPFLTGSLTLFITVFKSIMDKAFLYGETWIIAVLLLLLAPLAIGYIIALTEYFRGTD